MIHELDKISIDQKTGLEPLTFNNCDTRFMLSDFWKWSASDLISNATRGRFAEFIVASALEVDMTSIRDEWSPYDLITPEGIKIEVKSAAFIQSWKQKVFSKISFSIKAARSWNNETLVQSLTPERCSHIYVFCLLKHLDQSTLNPMNLNQWEFYLLSTSDLNKYKNNQSTISLKTLEKLTEPIKYDQIKIAIQQV